MPDRAIQTRRLTLTHAVTHAAKRRGHSGLSAVGESVSLISDPRRMGREDSYMYVVRACLPAHVHVRTGVCARVCERAGNRLTRITNSRPASPTTFPPVRTRLAHVASFAPRRSVGRLAPCRHTVRLARGAIVADTDPPAIGTSHPTSAGDGRGNGDRFRQTFFRERGTAPCSRT